MNPSPGNESLKVDDMKSLPRFVFTFVTSTLFASAVFACTCAENSARSDFRRAKAILIGEVISNHDESDGVKITFKIEKQWKGHQRKEFTALWEGPGPCGGFLFENGRTYLVYARSDKMWVDTACDRTAKIEQAHDDIQKLNSVWFRFYAVNSLLNYTSL